MPSFIFNNLLASLVLFLCFLTYLGSQSPVARIRALPVRPYPARSILFPRFLTPFLTAFASAGRSHSRLSKPRFDHHDRLPWAGGLVKRKVLATKWRWRSPPHGLLRRSARSFPPAPATGQVRTHQPGARRLTPGAYSYRSATIGSTFSPDRQSPDHPIISMCSSFTRSPDHPITSFVP
jgi:hypothetical protein